jgi:hypothetical protein
MDHPPLVELEKLDRSGSLVEMESLNQCRFFAWCRKGRIRRISWVVQGQRVPVT